jgi:hypothetical protein
VHGHALSKGAVGVLNLASAFAHLAIEFVAQDREQPRLDVGTHLEAVLLRPGLHHGVLHQIVCFIVAAAEGHSKCP